MEKAIDRAIDKANLIGENCDLYAVLYSYKAIRELPANELDNVYDVVAKTLGFI